ncbi:MAG: signal peptidase I [Alphaproteobacteria bacterium 41-28]|nr:MAG: signal peptidase I [Alphaproteobacteria bacterium 41-28]
MVKNQKYKDTPWKKIKVYFCIILLLTLIISGPVLIQNFLVPFHIPSGSMAPTLLIGDNLFVSKVAYGYGRKWGSKPQLGEIAVFQPVEDPMTSYIKRIVGLPGDHVQMKKGILYINDVPCPLKPHGEFTTVNDDGTILKALQLIETLPNGLKHLIIKQVPFGEGTYDNTPIYVVPEGHYFMMGDNRDGSNDSRVQGLIGYIPFERLVGRPSFIYFCTGGHIKLWEIWKWPFTAQCHRIFKDIQ